MQLLGFYIRKYRNIKNQFVNLSSEFLIDVKEIEKNTFNIVIDRNPDYIENFFLNEEVNDTINKSIEVDEKESNNKKEENNIKDVSILVGKNGAGKSSIFYYILNNINEGNYNAREISFFIFLENKKFKIDNNYDNNHPLIIKKEDITNKVIGYDYELIKDNNNDYISRLTNIYYNYYLEYNKEFNNYGGIVDISTTNLLKEFRKDNFESGKLDLQNINDLVFLEYKERENELALKNSGFEINNFSYPESIILKVQFDNFHYLLKYDEEENKYDINIAEIQKAKTILKYLEQKIKEEDNNPSKIFKNLINISILSNFLYKLYYSNLIRKEFNLNYSYSENIEKNISDIVEVFFKNNLKIDLDENIIDFQMTIEISKKLIEFNKLIDVLEFKMYGDNFFLIFENIEDTFIDKFLELYFNLKFNIDFLSFQWGTKYSEIRALSTGEQSLLSFFSRLYYSFKKIDTNKKNIILLIDEGDAGFHPQWQKEFFNKSINFISEIFKDKNVQIIFTTNTPYMLSDVPKNYITFIEKDENDNIIIYSKNNDFEQTFAQNIHTLLSNSFFMKNGLIGDFAKDKINKIINFIKNNENFKGNNTKEIEEIRKIVNLIGEPIIKNKLNSMLDNQSGDKHYKDRIKELEEEVNRLRKESDNDKN